MAYSVGATRAGVPADRVDAGTLGRAVRVADALGLDDRGGPLAGAAAAADVATRADADHRPDGEARQDLAGGRLVAWLDSSAGVLAAAVQAGQ